MHLVMLGVNNFNKSVSFRVNLIDETEVVLGPEAYLKFDYLFSSYVLLDQVTHEVNLAALKGENPPKTLALLNSEFDTLLYEHTFEYDIVNTSMSPNKVFIFITKNEKIGNKVFEEVLKMKN